MLKRYHAACDSEQPEHLLRAPSKINTHRNRGGLRKTKRNGPSKYQRAPYPDSMTTRSTKP